MKLYVAFEDKSAIKALLSEPGVKVEASNRSTMAMVRSLDMQGRSSGTVMGVQEVMAFLDSHPWTVPLLIPILAKLKGLPAKVRVEIKKRTDLSDDDVEMIRGTGATIVEEEDESPFR